MIHMVTNQLPFTRPQTLGFALAAAVSVAGFIPKVHAQDARDFAVFGTDSVTMMTYSDVRGDIYSGGSLTAEFGYGIQRAGLTLGDMYAGGDYTQGSLSHVAGSVYANGSVTLEGSAEVHGSLFASPGQVGCFHMPQATTFSTGANNLSVSGDLDLLPGSYQHIAMTSSNDTLSLSGGNYFLESLTLSSSTTIDLDLSQGPINVFVAGDIDFATGLQFEVNGDEVEQYLPAPQRALASQVLFESHGDITIAQGFNSELFGTLFAPLGTVDIHTQDSYGAIIASEVSAATYLDHYASDYLATRPLVSDHCDSQTTLAGDLNGDGYIGIEDLDLLLANWGSTSTTNGIDTDGSGTVDQGDLDMVLANWGSGTPPDTAIPEPSSLALLALPLAAMRRRRC